MGEEEANRQVLCDIARSAFDVVNRLLARDQLLAQALRSDATTSRQIYREESITVEMATTLRERFPNNVEITIFTPVEETRTGADWYWRFERGDRAIHARVQAKRVQRTAFGQADGKGHVDIDLPQLDQLIRATSESSNELPNLHPWLATFARFDATPPCGQTNLSPDCRRHRHEQVCGSPESSLWIADAAEIRGLGKSQLSVRKIVEHSVRLDCILPCTKGPDEGGGSREGRGPEVKGFTLTPGLLGYQDCVSRIQSNPALLAAFEGVMCIRA